VPALLRITGGHPLHLARVAAPDADAATPAGGPRHAIEAAFDRLDPSSRRVLSCSAVLGVSPSIAEASRLTGIRPGRVIDGLAEASRYERTRVVPRPGGRFSFSHELVREVARRALTRRSGSTRTPAPRRFVVGGVPGPAGPARGPTAGESRPGSRARHALQAGHRGRGPTRTQGGRGLPRDAADDMTSGLA